jgi:hypothetical protein
MKFFGGGGYRDLRFLISALVGGVVTFTLRPLYSQGKSPQVTIWQVARTDLDNIVKLRSLTQ